MPELASAHANLAMAREDSGDLPGAATAYQRAVQLEPGEALIRANYGLLLLKLGKAEAAVQELMAAREAAQGNRAVLQAVGNGLRRAGQPGEAVTAMQNALAAGDGKPTAALLAELALAQRASKDTTGARASLEQALALDARYATAHYLLAGMAASDRDFKTAVGHYQKYLKLEPQGPLAARARERLAAAKALAAKR